MALYHVGFSFFFFFHPSLDILAVHVLRQRDSSGQVAWLHICMYQAKIMQRTKIARA